MNDFARGLATPSDVLSFWFGVCPPTDEQALRVKAQWFTKSPAFDKQIREQFGPTIEAAKNRRLEGWASNPSGWLALLIVLDQFTRNSFRDSAESFSGDAEALRWAEHGKAEGWDQSLPFLARAFAYLPMEHAEDMARQDASVSAFERLVEDAQAAKAPDEVLETVRSYLDYAERHRDVIRRFGRFPHRNAALGRQSTAEELEYLAQPGAGF